MCIVNLRKFFLLLLLAPCVFSPCLGFPGQGPDEQHVFDVFSINVSSCSPNFHSIAGFCSPFPVGDCCHNVVLCSQETRIHPNRTKRLSRDLSQQGWQTIVVYQPALKRVVRRGCRPMLCQPNGGVATFATSEVRAVQIPIPTSSNLYPFIQPVYVSHGEYGFHVVNCYLPSGNSRAHRSQRTSIMKDVFLFVATLPPSPLFILGDFQEHPLSNPSVAEAMCTGEWVDVLLQRSRKNS